jgi:hypothetical protein
MGTACKSCGAEIVFEAGKQSLACAYCGTVNQIKRAEDALTTSFDRIVPMLVTPQELDKRVHAHMSSGDFTPDDILQAATITVKERCYVAAYGFKVDYDATWSASFGFEREEPYTAYRNVTRGNNTSQEAYTAYRTVVDWRPASGTASGSFEVAGNGSQKLSGLPLAADTLATHAVLHGNATAYDESFTRGFEVEGFSVSQQKVFASLTEEIDSNIEQGVKSHAQGDRQESWNWQSRMRHETISYAVPVCHVTFRYREKEYNIWIGGHDPEQIQADTLPVDDGRKSEVKNGFAPALAVLITYIAAGCYWKFINYSILPLLLVSTYGLLRYLALVRHSKSVRKAIQTRLEVSNQTNANLSAQDQAAITQAFTLPQRPLFARVGLDKILLPVLTVAAMAGTIIADIKGNPATIKPAHAQFQEPADPQTLFVTMLANPKDGAQFRKIARQLQASAKPQTANLDAAKGFDAQGEAAAQAGNFKQAANFFMQAHASAPEDETLLNHYVHAVYGNGIDDNGVTKAAVIDFLLSNPLSTTTWVLFAQIAAIEHQDAKAVAALILASQAEQDDAFNKYLEKEAANADSVLQDAAQKALAEIKTM